MHTKLWQLGGRDVALSLVIAVFAPVLATLADAMQVPGFDFLTYDWRALMMLGLTAGITYLFKNFSSDKDGRFVGKIG